MVRTERPMEGPGLDEEIRAALVDVHAPHAAPAFEAQWAAAGEALRAHPVRPRLPDRLFFRRVLPAWAAAALILAALAVGTLVSDTGGRGSQARPVGSLTTADADSAPADLAPVVWYAPTDVLLNVSSLAHHERPAVLVAYDPIQLEVQR